MDEVQIKVGQVWKRKRDGRHIRITKEFPGYYGTPTDDWCWTGEGYLGKGQAYGYTIRANYDLVSEPEP